MTSAGVRPCRLERGATVAIIGGGPAGAFTAIHLLKQAQERGGKLRVVIFERRRQAKPSEQVELAGPYSGCPQCAGGISPKLNEAMQALGLPLPAEVIQAKITSITVQGNWKHILLPVPDNRTMLSVYRGALPFGQHSGRQCFDSMLLDYAVAMGAQLIGSRVDSVAYDTTNKPVVAYSLSGRDSYLNTDFVVFAGGVNEATDQKKVTRTPTELLQQLQPLYRPPALRKALIFELEATGMKDQIQEGDLHFIESSTGELQLDMCSIIPKRGYLTVTVIGRSVDAAQTHEHNRRVIRDFLELPQIRRTLLPKSRLRIRCICNPSVVVGTATLPFAHRAAAVGDMATSRQYKDGILSAHTMARDLAGVLFERGVDFCSLQAGYGSSVARFRRDNRFATLIFSLYRWFFTSPILSRVIYQTHASELKSRPKTQRSFERIFWAISSGDESYETIAWLMLRPSTLWKILSGGVYITLRNWLGECLFGLDWEGISRFPTAVSVEQLELKRRGLLAGRRSEFECIYTIDIRSDPAVALALLAEFGETTRPYLNPRWVRIRRTGGEPGQVGATIGYHIFGGLISFSIKRLPCADDNQIRYRVSDGFAHGGRFVFEVTPTRAGHCAVTVYLAFDYARGSGPLARVYWRLFRLLFPEFIHDVLWNHALCEFKQVAESVDLESEPELINIRQL